MFKGSFTALITPFKNNRLDKNAFIKLIHHQIDNGTNGLVPGGTTGESPTLSHAEHREIIKICVRESKDRIPIMAGTGSNSTEEAIDLTRFEINSAIAACISEMKFPVGENGSDTIKSTLTIDEFKQGFKLVAEKTSSFLSGQHLGHYYKYSLKDDILCLVYSILMSTPFEFGFHLSTVALYFTGNVGKNQGTTMSR